MLGVFRTGRKPGFGGSRRRGRPPWGPIRYDGHRFLRIAAGREALLREKELRIALVCFGGVSLAVYMHGITKEILKLARASGAVHAITNRTKRQSAIFFDVRDPDDPEYDTEALYFELLRDIGRTVELRVIVDIV